MGHGDGRSGTGPHLLTSPTIVASMLASVAAAAEAATGHAERSIGALVLWAALAALCMIAAAHFFDRGNLAAFRVLAVADLLVGLVFLYVSDTDGFFVLFPALSLIYVATSLAVTVGSVAALALTIALLARRAGVPLGVVEGHSLGFVGGAAFVVAFVRIALAEQRARSDVERMAGAMQELAAAQERNRIAREIHDGVGHALTAVHVHLETAQALASRTAESEAVLGSIQRAKEGAHTALQEVRRSVSLLRASMTHGSLVEGVQALAEESRHAGVDVEVQVHGTPRRLPPVVEFALYRVAQEGLTNVRRHASAQSAHVALTFDAASARVRVSDEGRGAPSEDGFGYGLVGIRERAALLGGTVEIRTAPGRGFELSVRVPA